MSVLLDTDFLVAYWNPEETQHESADALYDELRQGRRGRLFVTDYVVGEAATLAMRRARSDEVARSFLRFLLGLPPATQTFSLLHIGPDLFHSAAQRFLRQGSRGLSFTDCTSLEALSEFAIDAIATFDAGFRGLAAVIPEPAG